MTNQETVSRAMASAPIVPVIVIDDAAKAGPLASALASGGMTAVEVTLRTPAALEAIAAMKAAQPNLLVGAGTVLNEGDIDACMKAGVDFLVSPGSTPSLLDAMIDTDLLSLPGVSTASEALTLYEAGFARMKFFPAEAAGGAPFLKSLSAPLPNISFMPTGGVNRANVTNYVQLPNVFAVGGSWIVSKQDLANDNWDGIRDMAEQSLKDTQAFQKLLGRKQPETAPA